MSDDTDPKPMSFRQAVAAIADALPVDEEAERAFDRALARRSEENPPRKMIAASKLDEANAEIETLKRRIADFDTDIIVHTSAVQARYEAQLKTWKANHDQRKAERDALKVDRDRVAELYDEACTGFIEMRAQRDSLLREVARLAKERDDARGNARILAHSYENDCRPLPRAVKESLAYPVVPESVKEKP